MSCGSPEGHHSHEGVDCAEAIDKMYGYLDRELDAEALADIERHIDACAPCLQHYRLEEEFRRLVARSCRCSHAPEKLRGEILTRISELRLRWAAPAD